jgi:hypothetical protein
MYQNLDFWFENKTIWQTTILTPLSSHIVFFKNLLTSALRLRLILALSSLIDSIDSGEKIRYFLFQEKPDAR